MNVIVNGNKISDNLEIFKAHRIYLPAEFLMLGKNYV